MTNCHQLKMEAADGKKYLTDAADPETLLRLIQSVPSPKAEPMKLWLAKVGQVLIQQPDYQTARKYWNKLKERLKKDRFVNVNKRFTI